MYTGVQTWFHQVLLGKLYCYILLAVLSLIRVCFFTTLSHCWFVYPITDSNSFHVPLLCDFFSWLAAFLTLCSTHFGTFFCFDNTSQLCVCCPLIPLPSSIIYGKYLYSLIRLVQKASFSGNPPLSF